MNIAKRNISYDGEVLKLCGVKIACEAHISGKFAYY